MFKVSHAHPPLKHGFGEFIDLAPQGNHLLPEVELISHDHKEYGGSISNAS